MNDIQLSEFGHRRYHTYPHANGFADDGRSIVLGQRDRDIASLWKIDLVTKRSRCVGEFTTEQREFWFDIAADTNTLATIVGDCVYLVNLSTEEQALIYRHPDRRPLYPIPSIRRDGEVVIVGFNHDIRNGIMAINTRSGEAGALAEHEWLTGHPHLSPYDPNWISYCHEGKTETVPDRLWSWHAEQAPNGRPFWDQLGGKLCVGHEVACRHDRSVLAIAYGVSPAGPRGLYEIFFDGRPARLISEGDRDWHCNVSADGRWALVDSTGPHDLPGRGWENAEGRSDVMLVDTATGRRELLARTTLASHPWHPHPVFTPDGRGVIYAEARGETGRVHLLTLPRPAASA